MGEPDVLERARGAAARHAWRDADDQQSEADRSEPLGPDDLDSLAESAWWIGRMRECIAARERAYNAYKAAGNTRRAMRMAASLTDHYNDTQERTISGAWLQRGLKLCEMEPDCAEAGHVKVTAAYAALGQGDGDRAHALAAEALDIGSRHGDRDVMAFGLCVSGMVHIGRGEVETGLAQLDEATIAAVSGELGPMATGIAYCVMISACSQVADYQRAGQWTEAARRWCDRQSISGFPGICRVHHAEILRLRGSLTDAAEAASTATVELRDFNLSFSAEAFHELGEIRLRMGDDAGAEEAFNQAIELGADPQPGLALLQLRRGNVPAAASSIRRSIDQHPAGAPGRAKLLPTQVEVAIAAGDIALARATASELRDAVASFTTAAMQAGAAHASAAAALAAGDPGSARAEATGAVSLWRGIDMPYEGARSRALLAEAFATGGDLESARQEMQAARATFEKLGALPDAAAAAARLEAFARAADRPVQRRATKTFMFTDIVNSTNLLQAIGDTAWADLIGWHDRTLRTAIAEHGGDEIKQTGDGFFVAFEEVDAAIDCAVTIQRTLSDHRRAHGFAPQVRIGLHAAEASESGDDYRGMGVHESARIAAIAEADEIVVSAASLVGCGMSIPISDAREVSLKGIAGTTSVVSLLWREE